jgi:LPXTG-motif cell wall-anchored protein
MKYKILGVIGVLWGGGISLKWVLSGTATSPTGAGTYNTGYQAGHAIGLLFGGLLLVAGLFAFFKRS